VLSPGSRASSCLTSMSDLAFAAALLTAAVMPLTRHSIRPTPLPRSVMRTAAVMRSDAARLLSAGDAIATDGAGPLSMTFSRLTTSAARLTSPFGSLASASRTRSGLKSD
jgi:hypothetical protein